MNKSNKQVGPDGIHGKQSRDSKLQSMESVFVATLPIDGITAARPHVATLSYWKLVWKIAPLLLLVCLVSFVFSQTNKQPDRAGKDHSKTNGSGPKDNKAKGKKKGEPASESKKADLSMQTPSDGNQSTGDAKSSDTQGAGNNQSSDQQSPPVTPICRTVKLGPVGQDASGYHSDLDKAGGVSIQVAGSRELIMCGAPANVDVLEAAVQGLSGYFAQARSHQNHVVRLFYFRRAKDIASAINNSGGLSTPVKALGDDVLIFSSESATDDRSIHELKAWIALVDVPRPEVSLSAWSIQISSTDPKAITTESANIRELVSGFNQKLHDSLQQGWRYLETTRTLAPKNAQSKFLDTDFTHYLTGRFVWEDKNNQAADRSLFPQPTCETDEYCLGYSRMFSPIQPSLASMLVALVASSRSRMWRIISWIAWRAAARNA